MFGLTGVPGMTRNLSRQGPCEPILHAYQQGGRDATPLFRTVLSVAKEVGLDTALSCLEQCVTAKRLAWLGEHLGHVERSGDPLLDSYHLFYEVYLGLTVPADGAVVERCRERLVTRWWNHCPTLEACQALGLDTRHICRAAYQGPVQAFLYRIDPRLRFDRNYAALRPYTPYCEEILSLAE